MTFTAKDGSVVPDIHAWRKHLLNTQAQEFNRIFKLFLQHYLSVGRGFNMNEFAWKIGAAPEQGLNWRDVVQEKYGAEGIALLELLTGSPQRLNYSPNHKATTQQPLSPVAALFAPQPAPSPAVANTVVRGIASLFGAAPTEEEPPAPPSIASLFK